MKKSYFLVFILFGSFFQTFAQAIKKGDDRKDLGWQPQGLYNFVGFNIDRGIKNNIAVGFSVLLNGNRGTFLGKRSFQTFIIPTIKGNYYFTEVLNLNEDKIDVYAGLGVFNVIAANNYLDFNIENFPLRLQINAGVRYFISNRFGFKGELNLGRMWFSNASATGGFFITLKND